METRPDPDQLLRQLKRDTKQSGELKLFFGACAGAGKTYAMLADAQQKLQEGYKVLSGIVETHGRTETGKLLAGIPILPLREIQYENIILKEMDLDSALRQKPDILLVDELAHTNAVGSRHPKRWQDILELLEHGIDVYTTLNVQHIESLVDTVENITGIRVKETIPNSIFARADEIILVDIPSEVILERLQEGKVYLGEFAKQRAAQNFFKIENLIALREIALRLTAERVDALRDQQYQVGKKPPISEKILVCIGPHSSSAMLVRKAKQDADKLKCPFTVLYVENARHYRLTKEEQDFVKKTLYSAEQIGAKTRVLQENHVAEAIIHYAQKNGFTRILVGKSSKPKWKRKIWGSLVNDLIELSNTALVYVFHEETPPIKKLLNITLRPHWIDFLNTIFTMAICTLLGYPGTAWLIPENVIMIYFAGVVIIAANTDRYAAILAAILSVICYKFFFIEPHYDLGLDSYSIQDLITLAVLLLTGLTITTLTSQLRMQIQSARQREKYTAELYTFSKKLIVTPGKNKIATVAAHHIGDIFNASANIWLPDHEKNIKISDSEILVNVKEESVARWTFLNNKTAGLGTDTMPSAKGYYLPLTNGERTFGVLGVTPKDPNKTFNSEENMMLEALAIQVALALERTEIAENTRKIKNLQSGAHG